jgi:hypothetical protein
MTKYRWLLCGLVLHAGLLFGADRPMSPDEIRVTFDKAFAQGRADLSVVGDLLAQGPAAAPVIGPSVAQKLEDGLTRKPVDEANLLRLAAGFGDKGAMLVPVLTKYAAKDDVYVVPAIEALGNIGPAAQPAVPTIVAAEKFDLRKFYPIAKALGQIKGPEAEKALRAELDEKKPLRIPSFRPMRMAAAKLALAEINPKSPEAAGFKKDALDLLIKETMEGDTSRRAQARVLIASLDASAALAFVPLVKDRKTRDAAVEAILVIHTGEAGEDGGRRSHPGVAKQKRLSSLTADQRKSHGGAGKASGGNGRQ